jgi:putative FmdB family regulatory protein
MPNQRYIDRKGVQLMAIFEYKCEVCGETFERFCRGTAGAKLPVCPTCGSKQVERVFSVFAKKTEGSSGCGSTVGSFG